MRWLARNPEVPALIAILLSFAGSEWSRQEIGRLPMSIHTLVLEGFEPVLDLPEMPWVTEAPRLRR